MLVAIAVTMALLAEPARADAPSVGAQFHATWSDYEDAERLAVLDKLAAAGVEWVRIDLGWRTFEEAGKGELSEWYAARADQAVDAALARGMRVLATLQDTPAWANGGRPKAVPPDDPADYARFAGCAATHFKGRVAAWEVWNEPNLESFWAGADPARYATLLRAAHPALKAGDPEALVVAGAVSRNDDAWLGRMYDAGAGGAFDVVSTHPYPDPSDSPPELPDNGDAGRIDHIAAVRRLMDGRGDSGKELWVTELGWSSHGGNRGKPSSKRGVTAEQQADYLRRSLDFFASRHPYVSKVFWYNERDKDTGDPHEDGFGLLSRDLDEKPAYRALASRAGAPSEAEPAAPRGRQDRPPERDLRRFADCVAGRPVADPAPPRRGPDGFPATLLLLLLAVPAALAAWRLRR